MESIKIPQALYQVHLSSSYQTKLLICLSLSAFSFSSYIFGVPMLLSDDQLSSNMTNFFILINEDYYQRIQVLSSSYLSIPIGGIIFSCLSDKIGRRKFIKYFLMWIAVFYFFLAISITINIVLLCSLFIGGFSVSGIISIFLYLNESIPDKSRVLANVIILLSLWLSLFFTTFWYYFYLNWRIVMGLSSALALGALYLLESLFESVEWTYVKEGGLKTEIVLKKISGGLDQDLELDDEEGLDERISNAKVSWNIFGILCDWVNFAVLFGWILVNGIRDLYVDKLCFGFLSVLGLSVFWAVSRYLNSGVLRFFMILSRAILVYLQFYPNHTLIYWILVLSQIELEAITIKTDRLLNPLFKSKVVSLVIIFSFIFSYYTNTSNQFHSHPAYLLTLLTLLTLLSTLCSPLLSLSQYSRPLFFQPSSLKSCKTQNPLNHLV